MAEAALACFLAACFFIGFFAAELAAGIVGLAIGAEAAALLAGWARAPKETAEASTAMARVFMDLSLGVGKS